MIPALTLASCKALGGDRSEAPTINTVTKQYSKPADETWRAVQSVAKDLDLKIDTDQHDALGGNLVALRSNKDEVHVDARSQDAMNTTVSIWASPGDRSLAQIIHDRLGDRLGLTVGASRSNAAAGSQVDGTYDQKLDVCMKAAEKAVADLKMTAPRREIHDTWARVDTNHMDSIPVQIRMERTRKDQTFVVFTVGTGASDDNRTLAGRLKAQFEQSLDTERHPQGQP
jgi:hypothetical protein